MYIDKYSGFVVSRDGFILVTNELRPTTLNGYIKYSPVVSTSPYLHYFPITRDVNTIVKLDTLHNKINLIDILINNTKQKLQRKLSISKKSKTEHLLKVLTEQLLSTLLEILKFQVDNNKFEEEYLGMNNKGEIFQYTISFDKKDDTKCERFALTQCLPIGEGSEWVISHDSAIADGIEAALRSTKTKEELLILLQKTGFINEGVWLTPKEYLINNNIAALIKNGTKQNDDELLAILTSKEFQ